jgi:hypothetical protein
MTLPSPSPLALPPHLRAIHEADYPRFSDAEMANRRAAIVNLLGEFGLAYVALGGVNVIHYFVVPRHSARLHARVIAARRFGNNSWTGKMAYLNDRCLPNG